MATTGNNFVNSVTRNLMANGMKQPGQNNEQNGAWQQMMMMSMLRNMSPRELLGYNVGNLLQKLFGQWKDNYDFRGDLKAELGGLTPEERAKRIAEIQQQNPNRAGYIQRHVDKWFPPDTQASAAPAATQEPPFDAMNQAAGLLNNPDSGAAFRNALASATDWEEILRRNSLPQVNAPF